MITAKSRTCSGVKVCGVRVVVDGCPVGWDGRLCELSAGASWRTMSSALIRFLISLMKVEGTGSLHEEGDIGAVMIKIMGRIVWWLTNGLHLPVRRIFNEPRSYQPSGRMKAARVWCTYLSTEYTG